MGLLKKLSAFTEKLGIELKQANKDKLTLSTYQKLFPKDSISNKRFYNIGAIFNILMTVAGRYVIDNSVGGV